MGPRAEPKLFTLQTLPARAPEEEGECSGAARIGGFSLHAGAAIAPVERCRLGPLFRYVSRPLVARAPGAGFIRPGALRAQDPVSRRHDAPRVRTARDHRQHRGAAGRCEDSVARAAHGAAARPGRAASGGAGPPAPGDGPASAWRGQQGNPGWGSNRLSAHGIPPSAPPLGAPWQLAIRWAGSTLRAGLGAVVDYPGQ